METLNKCNHSISKKFLLPGDEILLTEIEHHANIIPWQMVAKEYQLEIKYISVNENFSIDLTSSLSMYFLICFVTREKGCTLCCMYSNYLPCD